LTSVSPWEEAADQIPGVEQYAMRSFAEALEARPFNNRFLFQLDSNLPLTHLK